jgi:hypothetical protein
MENIFVSDAELHNFLSTTGTLFEGLHGNTYAGFLFWESNKRIGIDTPKLSAFWTLL